MNSRNRDTSFIQRDALKIAATYFIVGTSWIAISDPWAEYLVSYSGLGGIVQLVKGWLYVLVTAGFAYWLVARLMRDKEETLHLAEASRDELRETKAILQASLEQSQSGVIIADAPSGRLRFANGAAMRIRGAGSDVVGPSIAVEQYADAWQVRDLDGVPMKTEEVPLARAILFGETNTRELIIRRSENDDRIVVANAVPITSEAGKVVAGIVVFLDITDLKKAEIELRETETRFFRQRNAFASLAALGSMERDDVMTVLRRITEAAARTLEVARVSIWRYDKERTFLNCIDLFELKEERHSAGSKLLAADYPVYFQELSKETVIAADEAKSDPFTVGLWKDYLEPLGISSMMDAPIHFGGSLEGVLCHEHIGPSRRWTADEKTFVAALANLISLALERWERLQTEAKLRSAQERLQRAVSASNVGLWDWDVRTNELFYTPEAKLQLGFSDDEIGSTYEEWVARLHPDDSARALGYAAQFIEAPHRPYSQEFRLLHKDGTYRWILAQGSCDLGDDGRVVRILGSHIDISERKRLEAEFFQAQKMESVGRLAGGVAHDFNNLLTVISGYTQMALHRTKEEDASYKDFEQVLRAADRAANLTRQLLAFSRRQILQPTVLDVNQVVADAEKMLGRLIGEDIQLVIKRCEQLGHVVADAGQLEQVIMNLVINARDAMPMGGSITIETSNETLDESITTQHAFLKPGLYICLTVSDTGTGMDKAVQEKIFEPFFTTKDTDKGTGLGLATVYGIVKQSGGSILVYSEVGHGTTFRIYLRRVEEYFVPEKAAKQSHGDLTGNETVLVVEDEEALRQLTARILVLAGYKVLTATHGADALEKLSQLDERIDILLTDVIMPGMSGRELARQLCERMPHLKVLYMSGYTDTAISAHGVLEEGTHLINKPFTAQQILRKLREVLNKDSS